MICPRCKKEVVQGSKFCEFCGTPLFQGTNMNMQSFEAARRMPQEAVIKKGKEKNAGLGSKTYRIIAFAGIGLILMLVIGVVMIKNHKKTLDLQEYMSVEFSGYEKYGTANLSFDWEKFYSDIKKYAKGSKADELKKIDDAESLVSVLSSYTAMRNVTYEIDKDYGLDNGDKVTVTYKYDNEKMGDWGIKLKGEKTRFTVKGLEKVKEFDPFENLEVTFSGFSPDATVEFENTSNDNPDIVEYISYTTDNRSGIAKGDKIIIKVNYDEEALVEEFGYRLSATQKEYTCDEVDEYIQKYEDISEEYIKTIQSQATDVIDSYVAQKSEYLSAGTRKYEGVYFLVNKEIETWEHKNVLYVIYSAKVESVDKSFKKSKVYFPVKFTDVQKYKDGTYYVDLSNAQIVGNTDLEYSWYSSVNGYTKTSIMYNELVATQKASYTEEVIGELK